MSRSLHAHVLGNDAIRIKIRQFEGPEVEWGNIHTMGIPEATAFWNELGGCISHLKAAEVEKAQAQLQEDIKRLDTMVEDARTLRDSINLRKRMSQNLNDISELVGIQPAYAQRTD